MNPKEHRIESATVRLIDNGIIENMIHDHQELCVPELLEIKSLNTQLSGGKPYAVLVNSGQLTTITKAGRELSASKEFVQNTVAKALLVKSVGHRIVGQFYLRVNKPHVSTKLFGKRDEAIDWLRTQL